MCPETWLDEIFTQNTFPDDNYSIINRSDRNTGSHGGVLILSRKCLKVRKVSLNADFMCSVIYNNVLIITIYNPPFTSDFVIKHIILTENIDRTIFKAKCDNIIICGDINMPKLDWNSMTESTTSEYPLFLEMSTKNGYEQIITSPTHQSGNNLDCVLINFWSTHFTIVENSFSDHYFVEFGIPRTHYSCESTSQPILSLEPYYPIINQCIGSILFSFFIPDTTACYSHWIGELTSIIQPFLKRKRQRRTQFPSFYTLHTIHMLNKLHTTQRRIYRQPTYIPTPSVQILTTNVQESIALDTHIFIEKFLDANLNVNDCYKLNKSFQRSKTLPACMTLNDEILVADLNKANGFNKYFWSVFKKDSLPFSDFSENTLNNFEFTIQDVDKALRQTKRGSSTDVINGDFILQTSNALGIRYQNLLKNLLNHSYWPNEWKQAIITPLHNTGNIESICNYRPISCLSKISLVFERLLFNKLYDFLSPQLSGSQFGFMRRKSTVLQLIIYLHAIYNNVDTNTDCYALYFDVSKAFDSVSHATLLAKLRFFGIGGSLLSLLSSYLTNRVQCVKLNNIISASLPVTSGVPQGSILGPLFFLVFINDLPTEVSHSKTFLYADDLELIHNNLLEMQNDILALSQWSNVNKLSFNAKKTQLISFDFRLSNLHHRYSSSYLG